MVDKEEGKSIPEVKKEEAPKFQFGPDFFKGAKLKVDRAVRHIQELEFIIREFLKEDFYSVTLNEKLDSGYFGLRVNVTKGIPDTLAPTLGDAIHNLRSALDYIATAIVRAKQGNNVFVNFPFDKTRDNLVSRIDDGPIETALPGIKKIILEQIRPFMDKDGDGILWTLTKLDKIDKHNMLIPTLTVTGVHFERVKMGTSWLKGYTIGAQTATGGYPMVTQDKLEIEGKVEPRFEVLLGEGEVIRGKPILPSVIHMLKAVQQSIVLIEGLAFASNV